ncbi:hypothetical protein B7494_g7871 [Chlorociboria aeruginascens]|nr:hypothetical protein B7494_g7871 [Chlorociboria aeruginascens]
MMWRPLLHLGWRQEVEVYCIDDVSEEAHVAEVARAERNQLWEMKPFASQHCTCTKLRLQDRESKKYITFVTVPISNSCKMASTRGHPEKFDEPILSPSKSGPPRPRKGKWAHTPSSITLIWLFISLPLVAWDVGYCLLRPYSMPGGSLHWPLWTPYGLYGKVDYIYGWKAFNEKNGFTGAQSFMNVVESFMYVYYLYLMYAYGKPSTAHGRGAPKPATAKFLSQQRQLHGRYGAVAVLVGFSAALMTLAKTVLYWMCEYYSGFENIGHNTVSDLIFMWIIPNGAWLVGSGYIIYVTGSEILQGLIIAAGATTNSSDNISPAKTE